MLITEDKVFVHFETRSITVFRLKSGCLEPILQRQITFNTNALLQSMYDIIDAFLSDLPQHVGIMDNEHTRLCATGVFQELPFEEQNDLQIHVFVYFGLYFNIISPDLERFYLEKSAAKGHGHNIIEGLNIQEFRKVVVCGSFQEHLSDIGDVMNVLQKYGTEVLSPWTTKVVPETLGTDFILLEGQTLVNKRDAWRHKYEHMKKFKQSDAIIVCNPDGLVGKGTMFEFGFIVSISKRIIFTERPRELSILFPYEVGLNLVNL